MLWVGIGVDVGGRRCVWISVGVHGWVWVCMGGRGFWWVLVARAGKSGLVLRIRMGKRLGKLAGVEPGGCDDELSVMATLLETTCIKKKKIREKTTALIG